MDDRYRDWIKYSSLGLEMAVIIGVSVWAGVAIDRRRDASFPLAVILMTALGLIIAFIRLFRSIK